MAQILVIEDDVLLLQMYLKLFTNHGYQVKTATDGDLGLKLAFENHPDLILLDLKLPKMDGITVMHKLRADDWGKQASIILLTNLDANDEILSYVVTDQPSYYLIKSNNPPQQVLEKVKEVLENKKGD